MTEEEKEKRMDYKYKCKLNDVILERFKDDIYIKVDGDDICGATVVSIFDLITFLNECSSKKYNNDLRKEVEWYFEELRNNKNNHLGLGDIRLTIGQQEEILEILTRKT